MYESMRCVGNAGRRFLFAMTALACVLHPEISRAQAAPPPPGTSDWKCAFCPFDYTTSGAIDLGVIAVDSGSYQYGKYSGLNHSGGYPLLDGQLRYRNAAADYFDLDARRLGLLSRSLSAQGGRQGLIELKASFQGIPYYSYGDALTPFSGTGGSRLTLPSNWVAGSSTQQMTELPQALNSVGIRQKREIAALGGRYLPPKTNWTFDVDYRHDKQSGTQIAGANFLTTTSLLAAPVDYATDQVDAAAQYIRQTWQIRFGYYGSFFHDADSSITWDNPFTPFIAGANIGRMSTAPDNDFNQFSLSGAWQIFPSTRLMASGAFGVASQDDAFMGSSLNPDLSQPLPRSSLDGRIDTGNYTLRLTSRPLDRLSLTADYVDDRRDNKTAQAAYPQVVTDVYLSSTLFNLPYSFDRATGRVIADYSIARAIKLEVGAKTEHYDTTFQEVARSITPSAWIELRTTVSNQFGFSFRYDRSHRMIDEYQTAPTIILGENPLLQRFDLADRIRDELLASAWYTPVQSVSLGLSVERHRDNYDQSEVGLTGARDYSLNLTGSWTPTHDASLNVYLTRQIISADQAGSQSVSQPDWFAHTADRVSSGGIGGQLKNILPKLNVGANVYASFTNEIIHLDLGTPDIAQFPNNTYRDLGLRLFANYQLSAKSSLRFDFWHERYRTQDWALDSIAPATILNALTLGVASPDFTVDQVALSYRLDF